MSPRVERKRLYIRLVSQPLKRCFTFTQSSFYSIYHLKLYIWRSLPLKFLHFYNLFTFENIYLLMLAYIFVFCRCRRMFKQTLSEQCILFKHSWLICMSVWQWLGRKYLWKRWHFCWSDFQFVMFFFSQLTFDIFLTIVIATILLIWRIHVLYLFMYMY